MKMNPRLALLVFIILAAMAAMLFADVAAAQDYPQGYGPNPVLPAPQKHLIPTVNVAPTAPWQGEAKPEPAPGFSVTAYSRTLDHPRWLHVLPNGDVLVAETAAPPKPDDSKGLKGAIMKHQMKKAGSAVKSADRITLLRDIDARGSARLQTVFIKDLRSPFGMALIGNELFVANTDGLLRFPYETGQTTITAPGVKVMDLPGGTLNHHWTKGLVASPDGRLLYIAVGSNSNVGENGMEKEDGRAAIWQYDRASGKSRLFATGLRNPVGMAFEPRTQVLWTVVNERDELGDDLVPDYLTSVKDGAFYGWPYSYYGANVDARVKPPRPDMVARAIAPDYALGSHTASLGLAFYDAQLFPASWRGGAYIGQHGSWNRKVRSGYKVVFVPFADGRPAGPPVDILTGFLNGEGKAQGRPVGVAVDKSGALLVADDVGNAVWRVAPATR